MSNRFMRQRTPCTKDDRHILISKLAISFITFFISATYNVDAAASGKPLRIGFDAPGLLYGTSGPSFGGGRFQALMVGAIVSIATGEFQDGLKLPRKAGELRRLHGQAAMVSNQVVISAHLEVDLGRLPRIVKAEPPVHSFGL